MVNHSHDNETHHHGASISLTDKQKTILKKGIQKLIELTSGLSWKKLPSDKYPKPLVQMTYSDIPSIEEIKKEIEEKIDESPISILENVLAFLELYESNKNDASDFFLEDMPFIRECFATKRLNGWISIIGESKREKIEEEINTQWNFRFFNGRKEETGIYTLLSMLARYAFVYGRIQNGDFHSLSHFVEDFCPGVIVCFGEKTELEYTLVLTAMKMGVPAVVSTNFPFQLGKQIRVENIKDIYKAIVGFRNIHRLLDTPEVPKLPEYCDVQYKQEKFEPTVIWGNTEESFYIIEKGEVKKPEILVRGQPSSAMGIKITIDAEPMDAFDRRFIEKKIPSALSMIKGVRIQFEGEKLKILFTESVTPNPEQIGEVLFASIRHEFPVLKKIGVEIIFDKQSLKEMFPDIIKVKEEREYEITNATEENIEYFYQCVGCSPFAPDHVCTLTPERPPQCGRAFASVKTGAHYSYDDMTNIHHSWLHNDINSFIVIEKGRCLDPIKGEWSGVNEFSAKHSQGRTTRVFLHSLDDFPLTGCGCFRMIIFKTNKPREGIGIMDVNFKGKAPDGRTWKDLHYELAGKQTPGIVGASQGYLLSSKFLKAHGGWKEVVWISPKIAQSAKKILPAELKQFLIE